MKFTPSLSCCWRRLCRPPPTISGWSRRRAATRCKARAIGPGAHTGAERVPCGGFREAGAVLRWRGQSRPLAVAAAYPTKLDGECAALFVAASSGVWTKTAWETKNAPKTGVSGVLKSWRSEEFGEAC